MSKDPLNNQVGKRICRHMNEDHNEAISHSKPITQGLKILPKQK